MSASAFDDELPRDVWIDVETGEWGLVSNLRLVRQTDLPLSIGNQNWSARAEVRCAGIDHGIPVGTLITKLRAMSAMPDTAEPEADCAVGGPHDLVVSYGDCEFIGSCSCGTVLGDPIRPDQPLNVLGQRWEQHVLTIPR